MTRILTLLAALGLLGACEAAYPEVVVVNRTAEQVQLRKVTFSGCEWTGVLAYGASTSVGRCLPGKDRVHFEKFDAAAWSSADHADEGPLWFAYQTLDAHAVSEGSFRVIEITLDGVEQDFSVPGPYGH